MLQPIKNSDKLLNPNVPINPNMSIKSTKTNLKTILEQVSNVLIIQNITSADTETALRIKFEPFGPICYIKVVSMHRAIITFKRDIDAKAAKNAFPQLTITYGEKIEEEFLHKISCTLNLPQLEKNFLISPPPSPPLGWTGGEESICMIPTFDLDNDIWEGEVQILLPGNAAVPKITVENFAS